MVSTVDIVAEANLYWKIVGTGDFNGDGKADILWRKSNSGSNRVWLMNGAVKTSSAVLPSWTNLQWEIVGTGDFNSDGKVDILWRKSDTGENRVWLMNGTTRISNKTIPVLADTDWKICGAGDFNRDGKSDIVWRYEKTGGGGLNKVWLMNGTAKLSEQTLPAFSNLTWKLAGVGDFDGDGKPDLLWRYMGSGGANKVWLMDGCAWKSSETLPAEADLNWKIEN